MIKSVLFSLIILSSFILLGCEKNKIEKASTTTNTDTQQEVYIDETMQVQQEQVDQNQEITFLTSQGS